MADPVAPKIVSTTAVALIAELLGADLQIVIAALAGAILGDVFARPASLRYSIMRFIAATLGAAFIGATVSGVYSRVAAFGAGVAMHLFLAWLETRFAPLMDAGVKKATGIGVDGAQK